MQSNAVWFAVRSCYVSARLKCSIWAQDEVACVHVPRRHYRQRIIKCRGQIVEERRGNPKRWRLDIIALFRNLRL